MTSSRTTTSIYIAARIRVKSRLSLDRNFQVTVFSLGERVFMVRAKVGNGLFYHMDFFLGLRVIYVHRGLFSVKYFRCRIFIKV